MRIRIPDEIIELAKQHPEKKVEIYWAAVTYVLHWEMIYSWLANVLDPNKRRAKKMEWKQNRLGHTKNKSGTDLNLSVGHTKKIGVGHTKIDKVEIKKTNKNEEALGIYINNNILLYNIIHEYITSNINTWNISYLINKQWEKKYIATQMKEAEKIIKQVWLETFTTILNYIKQDEFRSKQILSIAKLNRKNKEWVPYYIVMMDNIRNYTPKVIHIPTV